MGIMQLQDLIKILIQHQENIHITVLSQFHVHLSHLPLLLNLHQPLGSLMVITVLQTYQDLVITTQLYLYNQMKFPAHHGTTSTQNQDLIQHMLICWDQTHLTTYVTNHPKDHFV